MDISEAEFTWGKGSKDDGGNVMIGYLTDLGSIPWFLWQLSVSRQQSPKSGSRKTRGKDVNTF